MAAKTFTGPGNFNDNTKWDGSVLPAAADTLTITTGTCTVTANDATVYGTMAINSGITFDYATFNISTGVVTVTGVHKIGVSAGTGCTCTGLTFITGSSRDWQLTSVINLSGSWVGPNEDYSVLNDCGT